MTKTRETDYEDRPCGQRELGGRAMLVGGCPRRAAGYTERGYRLRGLRLAPDALCALAAQFGDVDDSGEKYGIFTLRGEGIDLAVPRTGKGGRTASRGF